MYHTLFYGLMGVSLTVLCIDVCITYTVLRIGGCIAHCFKDCLVYHTVFYKLVGVSHTVFWHNITRNITNIELTYNFSIPAFRFISGDW